MVISYREKNSRQNDELMFSFKRKYVVSSWECFQIAHGSLTKAMCLPNRGRCTPCCARDLSRAFWLARTQTPQIVRLHRWIILDRTTILIPFDNTCTCFQIAPPKKCFQIAHGSHTKAVCLPNRGRCPPSLRVRSDSCILIGQNPNPTDCTSAPLDAPRSNDNPHPFRQEMQVG